MASAYALELIQKTKLTNAFVLVIEDDIESANQAKKIDSIQPLNNNDKSVLVKLSK